MSKWLSVKNKFPEFELRVLVIDINDDDYYPQIAYYCDFSRCGAKNEFYTDDTGSTNVTHWMPLPEPPKE